MPSETQSTVPNATVGGGLRVLRLKPEYRSDVDDLVQTFYVPCLQSTSLYRRAVGYFTSRGLAAAAQGIQSLIDRGGQMLLVASPLFAPDDLDAIQRGYEAREKIIDRALSRQLDVPAEPVEPDITDRLAYLAWLIANERLEIRIAIPTSKDGRIRAGIYHEKLGLFADEGGDAVAFTGSPNETAGGLVNNFETIDVFWSWDDPHGRVERKIDNFQRLWTDQTRGLEVVPIPEASRRKLLEFQLASRPPLANGAPNDRAAIKVAPPGELWKHQIDAILAWERNERRGIISMATGSGKTRAALAAAERAPDLSTLVIAIPRKALVHQWAKELASRTSFTEPVLVFESAASWQDILFNRLRANARSRRQSAVVVVGTMHSLSGGRFQSVLDDTRPADNTLLIVDEVHNIGAPIFQHTLREDFKWRLGLSATPERHFDDEGTAVIHSYFGATVYTYELRDALRDGLLCPYRYYIYAAHLSETEYVEYEDLTRQITQLRGMAAADVTNQSNNVIDGDSDRVRLLLIRRARILKKCGAKLATLDQALADHSAKRSLIYCADKDQLLAVRNVLEHKKLLHLVYTSDTPTADRQRALKSLARAHVPILLAIDCLDEGVDIPSVEQAIIIASSSNKRQFIQRRGRILRRAPDKDVATLVDVIALPPASAGREARKMLNGELARAKEMAELATNRHEALQQVHAITAQYGFTLAGLLSGEGDG